MRTILSLVAVAFAAATVAPPATAKKPPNFLFILADDQAWNGTAVPMLAGTTESGSKVFHTPNIDALAKRGMTFSNGYAAHPKCECSRAAILTGRSTTSLNAPTKMSRDWKAPASEALPNTLKRANDTYRA
ncbi:MAG: Choline-sulfatase, partial [Planctomycetota bacterium]